MRIAADEIRGINIIIVMQNNEIGLCHLRMILSSFLHVNTQLIALIISKIISKIELTNDLITQKWSKK